jgi:hypothetical protein
VSRTGWWITSGLVVALVAPLPFVLHAAPPPAIRPPSAGKTFDALCKDDVVAASRPDPAWLLASYAGDNCRAPAMPAALNGRTATRAQITAGMAAVKAYAAKAEAFETCVAGFVAVAKTRGAAPGKSFLLVETHRVLVSEKNRKLAAARMAAAINAFNEYGSECAEQ